MSRFPDLLCCCLLVAGCAAAYDDAAQEAGTAAPATPPAADAGVEEAEEIVADRSASVGEVKPRIIYTADVRLVADDFASAAEKLTDLVEEIGGYVASASLDRTSGESRSGRWTVRVPVAKYETFLGSLDSIGFVESRSQDSQDVTMEYVDVEARIANLQRLEERFIALLAERTGKLEDILKVEQELARVRGDIEQAQGRLRYLSNKTDFSTVTIAIREQKDYVPPRAPSFGSRIATTWSQSLTALRQAGEVAVLVVVAVAPWVAVAMVPLLAVVATIRLAMRRKGHVAEPGRR